MKTSRECNRDEQGFSQPKTQTLSIQANSSSNTLTKECLKPLHGDLTLEKNTARVPTVYEKQNSKHLKQVSIYVHTKERVKTKHCTKRKWK